MFRIHPKGAPLSFDAEFDLTFSMTYKPVIIPIPWWQRLWVYLYGLYKRTVGVRSDNWIGYDPKTSLCRGSQYS